MTDTVRKYFLFLLAFLAYFPALHAQYHLSLVLDAVPDSPVHPKIYLAGNMNNWNPGDKNFLFQFIGGKYRLTLQAVESGSYAFKFTRGSWQTVECDAAGRDISNREINIQSDSILHFTIQDWKDHFPAQSKAHTMSPNVHIIDTAFVIPQLNRTRRIWVYLPPDYKSSHKKYPVLYMQDGQNLFDAATAAYGEWGVDEILDSLSQKGGPEVIVVGIDNGKSKRLNEYNPYDNKKYGKGEGKSYAAFLVKTLKPFIDTHFRTLTGASNTGIAGSSMGGLISFYTWMEYPDVFGKVGIFSPSFWIAPQIKRDIHLTGEQRKDYVYFIAGGAESETMVPDMQEVYNNMLRQGMPESHLKLKVVAGGKHSEGYWHLEFPGVFLWLFSPH